MQGGRRILFIINPHAGRSEIRQKLLDILQLFAEYGFHTLVRPTTRAGEVGEIIAAYDGDFDIIVACGGDGTLNETLSGMMALPNRVPLGYLPSGTVNDFAASLGISRNMLEAARNITSGHTCRIDAGHFGDRYFSYIAAFGAFTEVSYQTPQQSKMLLGRTAYILEGIKRLPVLKAHFMRVEAEGFSTEGDFLFGMVSNSSSVGGFRLSDKARVSMSDGLLEVTLVRNPQNVAELTAVINSILHQDFESELIHSFKTSHVHFSAPNAVPWTLDGEFGGNPTDVDISVVHNAIDVYCPEGWPNA